MEKVTISNLQGESGLANVVRYFANNGAEYLIYSLNEVDEAGYTRLYVTKINGVDGNYTADTLNDSEWTEIKNLVKLIVKANKENQPIPVQDINPDKKYAKEHQDYAYRRNHGKLKKRKIQIPRDPYPEGIEMASTLNPEELKKENKDLRKKIAYLEDKVAYLEALYKVIKEDASEVSKKKDLKR